MLDGAARVDQVVERAAEDGQPGIAITDHGNMYGVLDFYKAAHSAGTAHEFTSDEARLAGRKGGRSTHAKRRKTGDGEPENKPRPEQEPPKK